MSRFERKGEWVGQEMYGGVGEPGELCVVLSHARNKMCPHFLDGSSEVGCVGQAAYHGEGRVICLSFSEARCWFQSLRRGSAWNQYRALILSHL